MLKDSHVEKNYLLEFGIVVCGAKKVLVECISDK